MDLSSLGHPAIAETPASQEVPGPGHLTIRQMARLYDVSLRTLRFYEDRGLIRPHREGTARLYRAADKMRLEMILRGKKLGFTLSEITDLISGASETTDIEERLKPQQILNQISHLERQRSDIESAIERLRGTHSRLAGRKAAYARGNQGGR